MCDVRDLIISEHFPQILPSTISFEKPMGQHRLTCLCCCACRSARPMNGCICKASCMGGLEGCLKYHSRHHWIDHLLAFRAEMFSHTTSRVAAHACRIAAPPLGRQIVTVTRLSGRQAITGRRSLLDPRTFFSLCLLDEMFRIWRRSTMMLLSCAFY
jgi:hypothetical protein